MPIYIIYLSKWQWRKTYRKTTVINFASHNVKESIITPRIINQEKGGTVLFVWNDVIKANTSATIFGMYEPEAQKHSVIYIYEKKVKVVSCSLNQERTLLAFSISLPRESPSENKQKVVYQAYLAELQSVEKNVFSLNMERSTFLKVQFLYPTQQGQPHNKESHMLVFLHKESIGLYRVPTARIGERGVMMSSQPKTEQIIRKFVWCQWDVQHQRLHYIQNVRVDNGSNNISQKMSTIQFSMKGKYENMLEIPINFPFPYIRTADKPHYGDIPLHTGIPELSLNVSVLTQSSGTFCLCYHKLITDQKSKSSPQPPSEYQDVEYYISMVHHAKTLHGCVYNLPKHVVIQKRLVFSWLGSYLLVMLPGYFVHLLNVGPSFEPCHHILLHNDVFIKELLPDGSVRTPLSGRFSFEGVESTHSSLASPQANSPRQEFTQTRQGVQTIPVFSEYCSSMKTLLPCQSFVRESGAIAQHLYDYRTGCMLKLVLNTDLMLECFRNSYWQTRLAMLHYLILHNKDFFSIKRLFEVLCENLTNSEVNNMFTEFLVASTFAEMKKQVDRDILNLLAFTSIETLRGQYEKNFAGERLAFISYLAFEVIDYNKRFVKDSKGRSTEDYWDTLIRRLRQRHSELPPRFSHLSVMMTYHQAEMEEAGGKSLWDPMHVEDSFFDGVYTLKMADLSPLLRHSKRLDSDIEGLSSGSWLTKTETVLGQAPLFLQKKISQESKIFKRRLSILTEDHIVKHLTRFLAKESQSKAKNVAKEYLHCQAKVSRQLCQLIWSLRGKQLAVELGDSLLPNLRNPATDEEYELFQLFERFYLTVGDLGYPLPIGFSSFFTSLGFKCLELHLFFQYVDNHILVLTPDFILQLLADLPDGSDEEIPMIKYQVISRLPQPFVEECFERWDHPLTKERKAREQISQILLRAPPLTKDSSRFNQTASNDSSSTFPPLDAFMRHLTLAASSIQSPRPISFDPILIESVSLYNTRMKTSYDLSKVNF